MKKDNLLKGAAVLGALALMAGGVVAADAAVNNSTNAGSNTSVNAEWGGRGGRGFENSLNGLSAEEKAAKIAEREANREANRAAMETRHAAVEAALSAGDYDAWVSAEGTSSPLVSKVNKDNFSQFVEAHNLMEQARTILSNIGVDANVGHGLGLGLGMGMGGGRLQK